jgi:Rhodopirellula transposase DDE domain
VLRAIARNLLFLAKQPDISRSYRTTVQLIAATTTEAGLKVRAELDENKYPKGVKVSDLSMAAVNLTRHSFHGD